MIEQGFNYADSTIKEMIDFFQTRVEKLEPKKDQKKSSVAAQKSKKLHNKRKMEDSNSNVVGSSKESTKARHSMDSCKDLRAMVSKHTKNKKKNFRNYRKGNKELNALIEEKFQENRKRVPGASPTQQKAW